MKIREFKLEEFFADYEFKTPYMMCASDCESFSVKELLSLEEGSEEELKKLRLGYTESLGNPQLREQISRLYENINMENVLVFSGAEEGIFIFMNVALEKGDSVIVQFPAYQSLFEVANAINCNVLKWSMSEEDNWELDIKFLKNCVKTNLKAIIINCPHNPTGYLMPKEKFSEIIEIARKRNIPVFSDEVYRLLEYNEADRLPAVCDLYDNGVSLGVMSKAFGLAGLRIGWIATKNKLLLKRIASFKNYTTICSSALSEFFSILALKHKDFIIKRNLEIIQHNLGLLDGFFERHAHLFKWIKPKAGSIAFPRMAVNKSVTSFCLDLLKDKGVLLMPSANYDFGDRHFRIGFGRKSMPEALNKLEEYLQEFF